MDRASHAHANLAVGTAAAATTYYIMKSAACGPAEPAVAAMLLAMSLARPDESIAAPMPKDEPIKMTSDQSMSW